MPPPPPEIIATEDEGGMGFCTSGRKIEGRGCPASLTAVPIGSMKVVLKRTKEVGTIECRVCHSCFAYYENKSTVYALLSFLLTPRSSNQSESSGSQSHESGSRMDGRISNNRRNQHTTSQGLLASHYYVSSSESVQATLLPVPEVKPLRSSDSLHFAGALSKIAQENFARRTAGLVAVQSRHAIPSHISTQFSVQTSGTRSVHSHVHVNRETVKRKKARNANTLYPTPAHWLYSLQVAVQHRTGKSLTWATTAQLLILTYRMTLAI
ncbi:hypothetical protein BT69DRAFT_1299714 [Atractiella rhizophila]|nr:hypothetical protein BT69DRAFT_1299714 [Atractiella rhizophila]